MLRRISQLVYAFVVLVSLSHVTAAQHGFPHWIWPSDVRSSVKSTRFAKSFSIHNKIRTAELFAAAEYSHVKIYVNDTLVSAMEPYDNPIFLDIATFLQQGRNVLSLTAEPSDGPAAIACRLQAQFDDDSILRVMSDDSWDVQWTSETNEPSPRRQAKAVSFGEVAEIPWLLTQRDYAIDPFDDYTQWKRALDTAGGKDPATFQVPSGFEIQLLRSAMPEEGSWVSLAIDPLGRLVIAREDKGLLRMTMSTDANRIESVETINDELQECRGLLFAHDSFYVNANNSKGLYRLRDSNGDGQFDEVRLLYKSSGGVGHGRNDLALGPDGYIYSIHGDAVDLPTGFVDRTSPFRARRGGANSREGHVIRTDAEGKSWELLAAGLRNPFGIDFSDDGEMFTYDADAEFDMGAPWYRPTRVNHIVSGGDYGWRGVTGNWPPYFPDHPDNASPNLDIGKGSPTAVKFGYRSRFPRPYQQALFILDWAYGRILAVHTVPRGASYFCQASTFLRGRPLNVTDLDFGPAGQMYFVTGGRKTRSALYRVRYVGNAADQQAPTAQQLARRAHARVARDVRRQLEALHRKVGAAAVDAAWPQLASADPWIRHAARLALEHQPVELWQQRALSEERRLASMSSLLALARSGSPAVMPSVLNRLNEIPLVDQPVSFKRTALYVYELCLADPSELDANAVARATVRLESLYPDPSSRLNQRLSRLLVRLGVASTVPKTLARLQAAADQIDRLHCLFVLRNAQSGWTAAGRRQYWKALRQTSDYLGGEGMRGFIDNIRRDALNGLTDDERTAALGLLDSAAASAETPLPRRQLVKQWKLADLVSPNDVGRVADYEQGSKMFSAALCARCHRMGQQGTPLGPDLTSVARRFSRQDILRSILEPSQVIAENYRSHQVVTTAGKVLEGRVIHTGDYRSPTLKIATDPLFPGRFVEIPKSEIEEYSWSATSYMPTGLLDTLSREEILDLLAYIESGANPRHPTFRSAD